MERDRWILGVGWNSEFDKGTKKRGKIMKHMSVPLRRRETDGFLEWDVLFVLWVVKCGLVEVCV